jgi:hypothetical protein
MIRKRGFHRCLYIPELDLLISLMFPVLAQMTLHAYLTPIIVPSGPIMMRDSGTCLEISYLGDGNYLGRREGG